MVPTEISHYRIIKSLGKGGMGEVYLAEDSALSRKVALKLLSSEVTNDKNRLRRFEQEARAASSLNHPNILTIHEIGQAEGLHFITTEFIDGVTLRKHLAIERMSPREALDAAIQVASALAAAHAAGIVHRDIKPENIMLRPDGYVKVLDFGLAKLIEPQLSLTDTEALTMANVDTEPGVVMGTTNYLSPEQARGLAVDARTDIFNLGVLIYEMLAGRPPFEGATKSDVIASILKMDPPPLARYSREVPDALEWLVTKALRKDREERYQTVKEMLTDLKTLKQRLEFDVELERSMSSGLVVRMTGGQPIDTLRELSARSGVVAPAHTTSGAEYLVGEIKRHKTGVALVLAVLIAATVGVIYFPVGKVRPIDSVAVLPFVNVNADPNLEYLSDGITESIIYNLSHLPNLKVMSRSSVIRYKERQTDPFAAARELGVRAVLVGRVVQRGESLTISAELVDARDSSLLWGQQYNRSLADILAVQEEIAKELSDKLRVHVSGDVQKQLTKHYTENVEAYQLYLKGRYYWNKRTGEAIKKAIEYFQQAIDKDPAYALAYAGLADSYTVLSGYAGTLPKDSFPQAKAAATKALAIDETLAEAHASLAQIKANYEWDWTGADAEFKRALELNPRYATAHHWYAEYLRNMGRMDAAIAEMKKAQELEPLSLIINTQLGRTYYYAHRYDEAIKQFQKTLEMDPAFDTARSRLIEAFEENEMYEKAIEELEKSGTISRATAEMAAALRQAYAVSGVRGYWRKRLDQLKERLKKSYVSPSSIARAYAHIGDTDQAFEWLEKAFEERDSRFGSLKVDPAMDGLRSDERFLVLLRRINLAP